MARFKQELPNEIIKEIEERSIKAEDIFGELCNSGADVVIQNVRNNMSKSFKSTRSLEKGLKKTKVYKTKSDDGINVKVGFYGYDGVPTKKYPKGTPIPLKVMAREYGTSRGEAKKPFFRKSFKKDDIENAMKSKQKELIGE